MRKMIQDFRYLLMIGLMYLIYFKANEYINYDKFLIIGQYKRNFIVLNAK